MKENEAWLVYKDPDNKRIKMHIKFDIQNYVKSNVSDIYQFINYSIGYIDDKYFSMLKKNIEYNLSGINELRKDKEKNRSKLERMLYSIENKIPELIEFSNKTLDYAGVDIRLLKNVINGIASLFKVLGENSDIDFSSDTQKKMLIIDFKNLIEKFNNKINWQIENAQYNCAIQNWSLPPWFALSNTINTNNYITEIKNCKYELDQKESNELVMESDEFGLTTAST